MIAAADAIRFISAVLQKPVNIMRTRNVMQILLILRALMQQKYRRPTAAHSGAENKQEGRCMDMRVFMHLPSDHFVSYSSDVCQVGFRPAFFLLVGFIGYIK